MMALLGAILLAAVPAAAREPALIGAKIKSDSWRILRKEGRVETFEGNVGYTEAGRDLRSDWARFDHGAGMFEARGSVKARQSLGGGNWLELEGHYGLHSTVTGKGELHPKGKNGVVAFRLRGPGQTGNGTAKSLSWNKDEEILRLRGDAHFWERRGTARAEISEFRRQDRVLTLSGRRPVVTGSEPGWSAAVQADTIKATDLGGGARRVTGRGKAQGWIYFDGPASKPYR